jgi:hypothetical protein
MPEPPAVFRCFVRIRQTRQEERKMRTLTKYTAAVALTGALALAAATPSEARHGRNAAAIGFGVGALAGAAVATSAHNGGYYGFYGYAPGYAYDSYTYEPYVYAPGPRYRYYDDWSYEHSTNNFAIDSQR